MKTFTQFNEGWKPLTKSEFHKELKKLGRLKIDKSNDEINYFINNKWVLGMLPDSRRVDWEEKLATVKRRV